MLTFFDAISYQKGALVLHALEAVVGEEKLTKFLAGWFDRHAFSAVGTADFEKELAAETGQDLSKFFAGFVHGSYHPEVRVTFAAAGSETELKVEQLQAKGPSEGFAFPLAVDLVDDAGHSERFTVAVNGKTTTKRVKPAHVPSSIVVDADETMLGTVACGTSAAGACKDGFRCQGGAVSVCVPK